MHAILAIGMDEVSKRLKEVLAARGWTDRELARRAGLKSETHVGLLLKRGASGAKGDTLDRIARAASVNIAWLLRGEGPRDAPIGAEPRIERDHEEPAPDETEDGVDVEALSRAISAEHAAGQWSDAEVERARRFVRDTRRMLEPSADLRAIARDILRAVRRAGVEADDRAIALRWAQGKPGLERHT